MSREPAPIVVTISSAPGAGNTFTFTLRESETSNGSWHNQWQRNDVHDHADRQHTYTDSQTVDAGECNGTSGSLRVQVGHLDV